MTRYLHHCFLYLFTELWRRSDRSGWTVRRSQGMFLTVPLKRSTLITLPVITHTPNLPNRIHFQFVAMMMAKVICVQVVSMLGYDFLFQDVDIVWYSNPLDYFHNETNPAVNL